MPVKKVVSKFKKKAPKINREDFYKKLKAEDKSALVDLSKPTTIKFIPTGSWVINRLIGDGSGKSRPGGFPRGQVVEVFGNEASGKSTLGITACKESIEMGVETHFLDFERRFNKGYAKSIGLKTTSDLFHLWNPEHFEHGAKIIRNVLELKPGLIIIDSVSAMIPKDFLEGNIEEASRIGLQAQLMSKFMTMITKDIVKSETCLIFINQERSYIKTDKFDRDNNGLSITTSGGRALRFYASVRLKLECGRIEKIATKSVITGKDDKKAVNMMVKATVVKNSIDRPWLSGPVYIRFGEGFDNIQSLMELAINTRVITQKGAFYGFESDGIVHFNAQGKAALRKILADDNSILKKVQESLKIKQDIRAKEEYAETDEGETNEGVDKLDEIFKSTSKDFIQNNKKEEDGENNDES